MYGTAYKFSINIRAVTAQPKRQLLVAKTWRTKERHSRIILCLRNADSGEAALVKMLAAVHNRFKDPTADPKIGSFGLHHLPVCKRIEGLRRLENEVNLRNLGAQALPEPVVVCCHDLSVCQKAPKASQPRRIAAASSLAVTLWAAQAPEKLLTKHPACPDLPEPRSSLAVAGGRWREISPCERWKQRMPDHHRLGVAGCAAS